MYKKNLFPLCHPVTKYGNHSNSEWDLTYPSYYSKAAIL
jgi:hypothetical protein